MLERREVAAGTVICKQGDLPDFIYFIVDGNVNIVKEITVSTKNRWPKAGGGYEEQVRSFVNKFKILEIGPGKYFGEIAIVNNTCRAATVQAKDDCILLALDKFEFLHLLNKGHAMANVYSQTQGYPNDEDILELFSALKVQKAQTQAIKDNTQGKGGHTHGIGDKLKQQKNVAVTHKLPTSYDKRRKSQVGKFTSTDVMEATKKDNSQRVARATAGLFNKGATGYLDELMAEAASETAAGIKSPAGAVNRSLNRGNEGKAKRSGRSAGRRSQSVMHLGKEILLDPAAEVRKHLSEEQKKKGKLLRRKKQPRAEEEEAAEEEVVEEEQQMLPEIKGATRERRTPYEQMRKSHSMAQSKIYGKHDKIIKAQRAQRSWGGGGGWDEEGSLADSVGSAGTTTSMRSYLRQQQKKR